MKWLQNGRLWFEEGEIEKMMETELRKAKLYPTQQAPAVDVERLIQRHLNAALDQYAHLDSSLLGKTEFYADAKPKVFINKDLTELVDDDCPAGVRGRWRATLAHEAAHLILHRILFDPVIAQTSLWNSGPGGPAGSGTQSLCRCGAGDVSFASVNRGRSDWKEVQANLGMAALLMPRAVFAAVVGEEKAALGIEHVEAGSANAVALIIRVAARFEVSKQAATIRFTSTNLMAAPGQVSLTTSR